MAGKHRTHRTDLLIQRLAARQHGTVARWQLLAAGISRHEIDLRIAGGRLVPIHRGVYLVGAVPAAHTHEMAALLAYHLEAALSHRSAAALWGLLSHSATTDVWITIPPARGAQRPRIRICRANLSRRDIRGRRGMAVTSPPRTILDCAGQFDDLYELEALVAEAHYRGLASETELRDQLVRNSGKRGNQGLWTVLGLPGGPRRTRSPAERALLRLLRDRRIDGYDVNATICGYEVDFLFRPERLVVEVDGWDGHSGRAAFERDRLKWATLQANRIAVTPVTGRQIRTDADGVIRRLLAALGR